MPQGRRWTVSDKAGNPVYLTDERWEHICVRHPELAILEDAVRETIRTGRRHQDPLEPQKYLYRLAVANLPGRCTHIEAVALFRFGEKEDGVVTVNNHILTAYPRHIR